MVRAQTRQAQITFGKRKSTRSATKSVQSTAPVFIPSPVATLQVDPAGVHGGRRVESGTQTERVGLPSPFALQPRGGTKYSPTGIHSRNSSILRAAMPYTRVGKRPRRSYTGRKIAIPRMYGRGDYWQDFKDAVKKNVPVGTFSRIGSAFGKAVGTPALLGQAGSQVGSGLGSMFSKLVGFGDYNVVANSLAQTGHKLNMGQPVAAFGNISNGTVVQHREYIQDVLGTGSTAFSISAFSINPGLNVTFPWLSFLAANYEQYEIRGMVFEYKSLCSDQTAGTASALGSVILATDYDSIDANYASKAEMEQSQYCTSGKPSSDIIHPIECAPNRTSIPINYIRSTAQPANTDIRLYDLGKLQIALSGIPAATAPAGSLLGELWVTYEIVLYKPQVSNVSFFYQADHFNIGTTWSTPANLGGFGTTQAIAVAKTAEVGSNLGWTITNVNELTCPRTLPIGRYMLVLKWVGASTALAAAVTYTLGTGLSVLAIQNNNSASASGAAGGETAVQQWSILTFQVTALLSTTSTISVTAGTLPGTPAGADIFVMRLPGNLD